MLACIACSSKEGGEDGSRATATTPHHGKEAVKSLTSQVPATSISISSEIPTYIFLSSGYLPLQACYCHCYVVRIITLLKGSLASYTSRVLCIRQRDSMHRSLYLTSELYAHHCLRRCARHCANNMPLGSIGIARPSKGPKASSGRLRAAAPGRVATRNRIEFLA
jgi:hypothetical protein